MTKFKVYREYGEPFFVEQTRLQTLPEKIHFAKQLLVMVSAIQVEFWHAETRYTVEFEIQNTL